MFERAGDLCSFKNFLRCLGILLGDFLVFSPLDSMDALSAALDWYWYPITFMLSRTSRLVRDVYVALCFF